MQGRSQMIRMAKYLLTLASLKLTALVNSPIGKVGLCFWCCHTDHHSFRWVLQERIIVLQLCRLNFCKSGIGWAMCSLKPLGEGPSLFLLASGSCSLWNPLHYSSLCPWSCWYVPMSVSCPTLSFIRTPDTGLGFVQSSMTLILNWLHPLRPVSK